jgi:hypothetical protein
VSRRLRTGLGQAAAALVLGLVLVAGVESPAHAETQVARILNANGATALNSGGSGTPFVIGLPSGAACPGDTAHHGYTVSSYALRTGIDVGTVNFVGGFPTGGTSLVTPNGTPYLARDTDVNTARVLPPPVLSWAPYAHQQQVLPLGTYNVGIACVNGRGRADRNWNSEVALTASSHDPGGFVWSVVGATAAAPTGSSTGTSHTGLIVGVLIAAAVVIAGVAFFVVRRRPRSGRSTAQAS